jgi:glycosyltransferase involved in cell wall biosynthesis
MKTILIAHNYNRNSISAMSYELGHHLAELGNRVVFISHKPYLSEKQIIKKGKGELIICSWSSLNRPTKLADFLWFYKIYKEYKPDTIIGHFVGSNITAIVSKIMSFGKTKTLIYYHTLSNAIVTDSKISFFKKSALRFRKRVFYNLFCDTLICPSAMGKLDLEKCFSVKKGIVVLNPMTDRFVNKKIVSDNAIVLSYLGRLDPTKGVVDLIQALKIYYNSVPDSKIKLKIAGSGRDELIINQLIKEEPNITFVGGLNYDKIDSFLNESHFNIIPSKFDNLPTVGLESLMNQTPLLISNSTGLTEYLIEGSDCFKFNATIDDMVQLFYKVENCMNSQPDMSIHARQAFLSKFTMQTYCNEFSKLI